MTDNVDVDAIAARVKAYRILCKGRDIWTSDKEAADKWVSEAGGALTEYEVEPLPGISPEMIASCEETIRVYEKHLLMPLRVSPEVAQRAASAYAALLSGQRRKTAELESNLAALEAAEAENTRLREALKYTLTQTQPALEAVERENPPFGSAAQIAGVALTYIKMEAVKMLTGRDLFAEALVEVIGNVTARQQETHDDGN